MAEGYLSNDLELQLRNRAPEVCRACTYLVAKRSDILQQDIIGCGRLDETAIGTVTAGILFRLAESGRCDEFAAL